MITFAPSIIPPFAVVALHKLFPRSIIAASHTKLACATQLNAPPPYSPRISSLFPTSHLPKSTKTEVIESERDKEGARTVITTRHASPGCPRGTGTSVLLQTCGGYAAGARGGGAGAVLAVLEVGGGGEGAEG